jgi:hypothetical protein
MPSLLISRQKIVERMALPSKDIPGDREGLFKLAV